jgi:hypothetical protein
MLLSPEEIMRKCLILLASLWAGYGALAQGTFTFSNRVIAAGLDAPVLDVGGATRVEGPNMMAAIFLNDVQLGAAVPFRTGIGAGYWNAGGDSARVIPGKFSGDVVFGFTVRVWDPSKGVDFLAVLRATGRVGISREFSITLGGPKADALFPPDLPGVMSNFQSFTLGIPEPSVLALGALGAVVLCWRRKE